MRAGSTSGSWYDLYVGSTGYPYWSTDSNAVLTSGTYTTYIEYFFNWKFTVGGCDREDTTFTVEIAPDPMASITVDTANATITATDWTASWMLQVRQMQIASWSTSTTAILRTRQPVQ